MAGHVGVELVSNAPGLTIAACRSRERVPGQSN
jgi:hypothetical protein